MKKLITLICAFQFVVAWAQEPSDEPVKDTFVIYYPLDIRIDTAEVLIVFVRMTIGQGKCQ